MNQRTLFDSSFPVPARPDSPPQVDGAKVAAPHAGRQARIVLSELRHADLTAEEICTLTGLTRWSVCGRLGALENPTGPALLAPDPLVVKHGRRMAASGVMVYVYRITPAGRRALA
ncbi:MAG TPA: hypothetical protein VMY35_10240 [Phycisphaerae bacterium]|nr:hypothetical protein [Phycisphaerae bacterium]